MNTLYGINYAIFAVFLTLFIIEVGVALTFLFAYKENKERLRRYLNPIWEITGTFAVFYIVNLEATYPSALTILGNAYLAPLLGAALFLIFRNAFIAYSEYAGLARERKYVTVYSISTLVVAFLAIAVLASGISGTGINIASGSINLVSVLFNPFFLLMFLSVVLIALFVGHEIFDATAFRKIGPVCGVVGVVLVLLALHIYIPYMLQNLAGNFAFMAFVIVFLVITIVLGLMHDGSARYLAPVWLFYSIVFFGRLQYPYWFGGLSSALSYLANSATAPYVIAITLIGGLFLVAALSYFVYMAYIKKGESY